LRLRAILRITGSLACILTVAWLLVSCGPIPTPTPTPTPAYSPTPSGSPTPTPTPQPLGSPENPLVIGMTAPSGGTQPQAAGDEVARLLAQNTGYSYSAHMFTTYRDTLQALAEGSVQAAWLPPFTYIYAHDRNLAQVALVANHFGLYSYGSQFMANVDSGFTAYYNPNTGQNLAPANVALSQFAGKVPCWVDKQSASGYVIPKGLLMQNGVIPPEGVITRSHAAVVRALYVGGICDYGAVFAISGDPRTSESIQSQMPDVMDKVIILWRSDAVIPNLNFSVGHAVPREIADATVEGLRAIVKTNEGRQALTDANDYDIVDLKPVNDAYYNALRDLLTFSQVDLLTLLGN
jgi:phosphonate transport system substrate-binding protein